MRTQSPTNQISLIRIVDVMLALFLFILLLPLFIIISILIKLESKGPVLFKQQRVGKNERPFNIYKFRSMYIHEDFPEKLGPIKNKHNLVTSIGFIIRRFKLDEIPQFINVLKGDMSLIGPRPCLLSRINSMTLQERRRFDVYPGITGWAEVNGNLELDWEEQLMLDLWYVDNRSLLLNALIFFKTITVIFFGSIKNHKALIKAKK